MNGSLGSLFKSKRWISSAALLLVFATILQAQQTPPP